ncbi:MAG: 16S rRNA (guanine(527)-N(7))-methyltransferase RsmG [Phycisphaeraceae bacterium]|nr:16S rRNA (guanine(527)-N(7))-methyltransferase RsmG [Phycisphaeraceae bacterium]
MNIPPFVHTDLERLGIEIEPDALAQLAAYLEHLLDVNKQFNLTAIRDPDEAWRKHILDSLTLLPAMIDAAEGHRVIDVGSGGGLPGLPLAVCRPDLAFTLLEATGKKARFLQETAKLLNLSHVSVVNDRAEIAGRDPQHRQQYDLAVCRALGPMRELLEYTLPLVKVGGQVLAMKGPSVEQELPDAGDALHLLGGGDIQIAEAYPPDFDHQGVIVLVTKTQETPEAYPRRPGVPRQSPL